MDFAAPNITTPADVSVNCGDSISPNVTGTPNVSDIQDPYPFVTYTDRDDVDCLIIRTWSAKDHAGNIARKTQTLKIVSVPPMKVCANLRNILCYISLSAWYEGESFQIGGNISTKIK